MDGNTAADGERTLVIVEAAASNRLHHDPYTIRACARDKAARDGEITYGS